ncbi:MAG: N-acetylmuramoyl-L-alanine amidase [Syntrophomonas sp.]
MEILQTLSPNFTAGRKGRRIIAIVNHITAGLMPGTLSWLRNPAAKASAHYLISKNGEVFQLVKDEDTAWHAGIVNQPDWALYDGSNPNYYTLGIEHEALAGEGLTEKQYQASLWLHRQLLKKWGIKLDRDHIIGHYRIDSINRKNDPGTAFPWNKLFQDLSKDAAEVSSEPVSIKVINHLKGIIIESQSYAPVRELAQSLGFSVQWDDKLKVVLIPPVNIEVPPSPPGGVNIAVDSVIIPGTMIGDRAYVKVRQLAEALGRNVTWDGCTRSIKIE